MALLHGERCRRRSDTHHRLDDPFLAGATLTLHLVAITALLGLWPQLRSSRVARRGAVAVVVSQWIYVLGEVLSNTVTIGEPPADFGSLLEIAADVAVTIAMVVIGLGEVLSRTRRENQPAAVALATVAAISLAGILWWFTHPIDQARPGAPRCIEGNPLYNAFRGSCR